MEIENSLLGPEINEILQKEDNNTREITHEIHVHTVSHDIIIDRLVSVEVTKDYNENYGDETFVNFLLPMGDLVKSVYPERNNLEISIIKILNKKKTLKRFKLMLLNVNSELGSGKYTERSMEDLNKEEMVNLKGQCIDLEVEAIRLKKLSGIYREKSIEDLLYGLFHNTIKEVKIKGTPIVPYITIVKPDNTRVYDHVIVKSGTKLIDLATYFQDLDYGVYNNHIGTYITKCRRGTYFNRCDLAPTDLPCDEVLTVFIYPLYKPSIVDNAEHKLIIYSIPNLKYSMVESTYLVTGTDIKIISSDDSQKINKGDKDFIDNSVGYVMLDPNKVMSNTDSKERPVPVLSSDYALNTKDEVNNEYYLKDRSDGSHQRMTKEPTDNEYKIRSDYNKSNGDIIQVKWNFSNSMYLLPGMAVIYTYLGDNNDVKRLNGVLQSHYTMYNQGSKMASTILNIFVEKSKDEVD